MRLLGRGTGGVFAAFVGDKLAGKRNSIGERNKTTERNNVAERREAAERNKKGNAVRRASGITRGDLDVAGWTTAVAYLCCLFEWCRCCGVDGGAVQVDGSTDRECTSCTLGEVILSNIGILGDGGL